MRLVSTDAATTPGLWEGGVFTRWFAADIVNKLGSAVTLVVLPILVYQRTGSAGQSALLTAIRIVPYIVLGLAVGPIADRGNRQRMIVIGNIAQGVCIAVIPIWAIASEPPLGIIYGAALASGVAFVFSDAATFGAISAIVGRANIARAQGLFGTTSSMSDVVGPSIGAVLVTIVGAASAIWIDAASFLVAAALIAALRVPFRDPGDAQNRSSARTALAFVRQQRELRVLIPVGFLNSFSVGSIIGLLVAYGVEEIGLGKKDWRIGLLFTAGGVGAAITGMFTNRIYKPARFRSFIPPLYLVGSAGAVILALTHSLPVALPTLMIASASWTVIWTLGIVHRMMVTPDHLRSTVNVVGRMVSWGGQPFGAVAGGIVAEVANVPTAYAMAAGTLCLAAIASRALLPAPT
jgi:MFS family permease